MFYTNIVIRECFSIKASRSSSLLLYWSKFNADKVVRNYNSGWYTFLEGRILSIRNKAIKLIFCIQGGALRGTFFNMNVHVCPFICRCTCINSYFLGISCSHCRQCFPVSFQPIMHNFALIILRRKKKKIANIFFVTSVAPSFPRNHLPWHTQVMTYLMSCQLHNLCAMGFLFLKFAYNETITM